MLTLVLLPGMDGTASLFAPFVAALGGRYRVNHVVYPGDQALGYAELETLARKALPTRGRYVLLGESFSGPIAVAIAASQPRGLVGLVLCATFVRNPYPVFGPLAPLFGSLAGFMPLKAAPAFAMRHLLLGHFATQHLITSLRRALSQVSASVLQARVRAVMTVDVSAQLAAVQVPVLYLQARHDRVVPRNAAAAVAKAMPSVQMVQLDAPHLLLQAVPDAAAQAVHAFLYPLQTTASRKLQPT